MPKGIQGFQKGQKTWNKGLTKETDKRVRKYAKAKMGENHPLWKGGRAKVTGGYIRVKMWNHPDVCSQGYILEHRLVMEKKLGRRLKPFEEVHHKNGIKDDNRPSNLELVIKTKHCGEIKCPYCQKLFKIK